MFFLAWLRELGYGPTVMSSNPESLFPCTVEVKLALFYSRSTLPWTSKLESTPIYNPPLRVRQAAATNLHKTCSSPSIFAMAGDSSWRSTNYSDFDGSRLDRKSDIFANDEVQPCPGNDRWHQSELHLTRPSDIANGSRFGSFPATTTTATSSTSTPRQRSSDPSDGSHESSPRKELNRSRESSMSEYRGFKFQLLNNSSSNSRRSSLENNQICSNYSGRIN